MPATHLLILLPDPLMTSITPASNTSRSRLEALPKSTRPAPGWTRTSCAACLVSDGFTHGSRYVTFYDPDEIPLEYYYMDAVYADVYGVDIESQPGGDDLSV